MGESTNRKAHPRAAGRHYGGNAVNRNELIQLSPIKVKIVLVVSGCLCLAVYCYVYIIMCVSVCIRFIRLTSLQSPNC